MNNGIPHDYSTQEYACDLTGCTFYFDNHVANTNRVRAVLDGKTILAFALRENAGSVEAYLTMPDGVDCVHYKNATETVVFTSRDAHLTYHGKPNGKKLTGAIHVKNNGVDPLKGEADKTDAPIASSSNIEIHPLPICRIELSDSIDGVSPPDDIVNYFQVKTPACVFNTIEVHLSRRGYMHNLASVARIIPDEYSSLFIHTSMHAFYLDRLERRPGRFPQALVLQTQHFELIILATHEYKNPSYTRSALRYYRTKDYFGDLSSRNIIDAGGGFFVDQRSHMPYKDGARRLSSARAGTKPGTTDSP